MKYHVIIRKLTMIEVRVEAANRVVTIQKITLQFPIRDLAIRQLPVSGLDHAVDPEEGKEYLKVVDQVREAFPEKEEE